MPQATSIMVASLCPAAVVSAMCSMLGQVDSTSLVDLAKTFGLPVVAAAAAAWVAYKLAFSVIAREWSRSDAQDARWEIMREKWDTITEKNIAALTSVEKAMGTVCETIRGCRGPNQPQPPHVA